MPAKIIDHSGKTYGRLTVLHRSVNIDDRAAWSCLCECGNIKIIRSTSLVKGDTLSCGCFMREQVSCSNKTHGLTKTPEYKAWISIKSRCYASKTDSYMRYGGRGIRVCKRWLHSFEHFLEDIGERPNKSHSIDRINNDGDYAPDNCRWATTHEQNNNKSNTYIIKLGCRAHSRSEWSIITGINYNTICSRLKAGWPIERALTTPVRKKRVNGYRHL